MRHSRLCALSVGRCGREPARVRVPNASGVVRAGGEGCAPAAAAHAGVNAGWDVCVRVRVCEAARALLARARKPVVTPVDLLPTVVSALKLCYLGESEGGR